MGAPQFEQAGADISGTGTTNTIPRWTGPSTLGDSGLIDNGTAIYTTTRNVGIGTASPGFKLEVSAGTASAMRLVSDAGTATVLRLLQTANRDWGIRIPASSTSLSFYDYSAGQERMGIDLNGNVGIGTASPVGRTDIAGTSVDQLAWGLLSVRSSDAQGADKGGSLAFGGLYDATNSTHWAQISGRKENGTSGQYGGYLAFATRTNGAGANTERARIDSAGRFGIGQTPTTYILETATDAGFYGVRVGRGPGASTTNTVVGGASSFSANTTGINNTAVGASALQANTSGSTNTGVGLQALLNNTSGSSNVAVGPFALGNTNGGSSNIALGREATTAAVGDSNQFVLGSATYYVATNGGATTYYATAGALLGYMQIRLNGANVKIPVYAP